MTFRAGVDIGGTFTDFVLLDTKTSACYIHKQLTTPADPSESVLSGIPLLLRKANADIGQLAGIVHGTTLVTNAVIERRGGASCAMICTKGFSSVVDIAHERRYDLYDLRLEFATPIVPKAMRFEVTERIDADGAVEVPLDEAEVHAVIAAAVNAGASSIAVCLLNSYRNTAHEAAIRRIAFAVAPELYVTESADVFPYMREYERWTTATINAYAQPLVDRYLARIEAGLAALGYRGSFHMMTSSGGIIGTDLSRRFPVRLLESGPAAGILMATVVGGMVGQADLLGFDMGGTTAKGALIRDGLPLKRYELEVGHSYKALKGSGLTVKAPAIDLIEIGSGGGSIAEVDTRGVVQVGPRSAGADPGPVCYGRGGGDLTVTDANLLLGYLSESYFLGGSMPLSQSAARTVAHDGLARTLGVDTIRAAWGVHETANEDIARAFRSHAAERGFDYRRCTMVASGGAGPAHALRVARKLRVPTVLFSPGAGAMSAFGLLASPPAFELSRSHLLQYDPSAARSCADMLDEMCREARKYLTSAGIPLQAVVFRRWLDMRYRGQGYEVEVELPQGQDLEALWAQLPAFFAEKYAEVFSTSFTGESIEIVTWKVEARGPAAPFDRVVLVTEEQSRDVALKGYRAAFFPETGLIAECPVYDRYALHAGQRIVGPALIEERETTCVIGVGDTVVADASGALIAHPATMAQATVGGDTQQGAQRRQEA